LIPPSWDVQDEVMGAAGWWTQAGRRACGVSWRAPPPANMDTPLRIPSQAYQSPFTDLSPFQIAKWAQLNVYNFLLQAHDNNKCNYILKLVDYVFNSLCTWVRVVRLEMGRLEKLAQVSSNHSIFYWQ
jgi:hypothetical protein